MRSPHTPKPVLRQLSWRLDRGWRTQLRRLCTAPVTDAALERLAAYNARLALHERAGDAAHSGTETVVGGAAWGVTIRMRCTDPAASIPSWWVIEEIICLLRMQRRAER